MVLAHAPKGQDGAAVDEAKVAGVERQRHLRQGVDEAIECARRPKLEGGFAVAGGADPVDNLVAFAPLCDHLGDHFRRILQVGVDQHDGVAIGVIEASGDGDLVAEVARQKNDPNMFVARLYLAQQ